MSQGSTVSRSLNSILVVDDDPIAQYLISNTIESLCECKNVILAADGEEAIKKIQVYQSGRKGLASIDLIFLDIKMPVMDGFNFLQKFFSNKAISVNTHVYIITGTEDQSDFEELKKYPVTGIIRKSELRQSIESVLKNW